MSSQIVQILAGAVVVAAFAGSQLRLLDPFSATYLAANFAGTAVLTAVALRTEQFGFVLTNGVWAVVSVIGLTRLVLRRSQEAGQVPP